MLKKHNVYTSLKRNPIAKQLRTSKFMIKIIKNKKNIIGKKLKKNLNSIYLFRNDFLYSEGTWKFIDQIPSLFSLAYFSSSIKSLEY